MTKRAFLGSFAIYLVPLVGPHAAWLLGQYLYAELAGGGRGRSPGWIAADFAVALSAQAALALFLRWALALRVAFRVVALAAAAPLFFVAIEAAYLLAIPSYFLIERDVAAERVDWQQECFLPGLGLATVRTPPDLPLERAGRAWVNGDDGRFLALLESCDRRVTIDLGTSSMLGGAPFVLADGKALFGVWEKESQHTRWWSFAGEGATARPLARPPADPDRSAPILANDGASAAWKEYVPGVTRSPLPEQVVIRALEGDREEIVPLGPTGRDIALLGVDTVARTLTLFEHDYRDRSNAVVTIGFDGAARGRRLVVRGVDPQATTFLRLDDGWIAWDAYREEGRDRLAWSLGAAAGSSEVLLGRGITAVGADPTGSYVAVSTTTKLNIGRIRDSVYVLSTSGGAEVFRRYLPTYTRSRVAFLGAGRFAHDDREGERFGVRIFRVPGRE